LAADGRDLRELAAVFLKLGCVSFGGPAVHIAMMEEEIVRRRRWLSAEEFLDLLGATNLIPGPNSTEMAIHVGRVRGGWPGLIVAGASFIGPAVAIVLACAWLYVRFGTLPAAAAVLYGMKPAVLAAVAVALVSLARTALRPPACLAAAMVSVALVVIGVHELLVLVVAGVAVIVLRRVAWPRPAAATAVLPLGVASASSTLGLWPLFLVFLKVGAVLYGSGYVLFAFLRADLVVRWHWLSEAQLLDAIAVGQFTPGPLFSTATFVGYVLAGVPGAAVATLGIFLPAFVLVAMSGPLIPRLRRSPAAGAFLDGVNAASLALMAVVTAQLVRNAVVDLPTAVVAAASTVVLWRWKLNSAWFVLGGALVGLVVKALG
jgi:chromate transporter